MGHIFRAINFHSYLKAKGEACVILTNPHAPAEDALRKNSVQFDLIDLNNEQSQWERILISRHRIDVWINDRLTTGKAHALRVKNAGAKLITMDDHGPGADLSDLHVASLSFSESEPPRGRRVLQGIDYLILSPHIIARRRLRRTLERIVISLGGSDTYGVTVKVAILLRELNYSAVIHLGPAFAHHDALAALLGDNLSVTENIPSLVDLFSDFDLAITGAGVTPFEANAAGLPALVIANELFEIPNGKLLHAAGSAFFMGHHKNLCRHQMQAGLSYAAAHLEEMSRRGMERFSPQTAFERIFKEIKNI